MSVQTDFAACITSRAVFNILPIPGGLRSQSLFLLVSWNIALQFHYKFDKVTDSSSIPDIILTSDLLIFCRFFQESNFSISLVFLPNFFIFLSPLGMNTICVFPDLDHLTF